MVSRASPRPRTTPFSRSRRRGTPRRGRFLRKALLSVSCGELMRLRAGLAPTHAKFGIKATTLRNAECLQGMANSWPMIPNTAGQQRDAHVGALRSFPRAPSEEGRVCVSPASPWCLGGCMSLCFSVLALANRTLYFKLYCANMLCAPPVTCYGAYSHAAKSQNKAKKFATTTTGQSFGWYYLPTISLVLLSLLLSSP